MFSKYYMLGIWQSLNSYKPSGALPVGIIREFNTKVRLQLGRSDTTFPWLLHALDLSMLFKVCGVTASTDVFDEDVIV